ncbi:hypothetical protein SCP_1201160 [Sparassis crispa]|uniref:Uncharacterized protein n=1 Tax=Sparassis crispa TaxID=139825 RepID=A0A401H0F1_9APHY|nr:hypothetical protein SCP_1201160 [Sparassis crispa]GBE87891.1 hypothetical protein SCP_1201160 [Sparassis crispa]
MVAGAVVASSIVIWSLTSSWFLLEKEFKKTREALARSIRAIDGIKPEDRQIIRKRSPNEFDELERLHSNLKEQLEKLQKLEQLMVSVGPLSLYRVRFLVSTQLDTIVMLTKCADILLLSLIKECRADEQPVAKSDATNRSANSESESPGLAEDKGKA